MYSRVYIEITNICNRNCSFCHGHSRPSGQMSLPQFQQILNQLTGKTEYLYYHLMGEPLTHPALPDFLRLARENGFRSVLTTNGTLLKQRGSDLIAAGLHKINISLHSFENGTWEQHIAYLEQIATFAEEANSAGTIVVLRHWNRGYDNGLNDASLDYFQKRLPGEWAENARGYRIRSKFFLEWGDRFQWPDLHAPVYPTVFCQGLRDQFGILCDGSVVPCCLDSDGVITLGNIFSQNLDDILSSPRAKELVDGFGRHTAVEELCKHCGFAQRFSSAHA